MKIAKRILILVGCLALAIGGFFGGYIVRGTQGEDIAALKFVLDTYKKYYLEETDDYVSVMANSIIDRYSYYYTKEEYELLNKVAMGSRAGCGITLNGLNIYGVIGNSPAEKAGIVTGGTIVAIKAPGEEFTTLSDGKSFSEKLSQIADDTDFILKIAYGDTTKEYTLKKTEYQETYVYYSDEGGAYRFSDKTGKMEMERYADAIANFGSDTGYIYYKSFNGTANDLRGSSKQIEEALKKFKTSGRKNLIFDLRGNGGGYLDIAQHIAAHFIDAESGTRQVVARAVDKYGKTTEYLSAKVDYATYNFEKIIFLADSNSASASEVLMGAAISYDKKDKVRLVLAATNVGGVNVYRTYGKGIMQTTYTDIFRGDALRLTTAYIEWPDGTRIHGTGLTKALLGEKCTEPEVLSGDYVLNAAINLI